MRNILVMWSGGIDSTYRLSKLLAETEDSIHAHHVYIANHEARYKHEETACKALLPKLLAIRPFTTTASIVDHSLHPVIPHDMQIVCFEAGIVVRAAAGIAKAPVFDDWTIGTHKDEGHDWNRWNAIYPAFKAAAWPLACLPDFKLFDLATKKQEIFYLKLKGLLGDCWYCRTPANEKPCGECKSCKEVAAFRNSFN